MKIIMFFMLSLISLIANNVYADTVSALLENCIHLERGLNQEKHDAFLSGLCVGEIAAITDGAVIADAIKAKASNTKPSICLSEKGISFELAFNTFLDYVDKQEKNRFIEILKVKSNLIMILALREKFPCNQQ